MEDKKELFEKQLNYITSNFEIDLQRLIKNRSYISMSENVIDEEIESFKKISTDFENNLKNLVMKTLEIEKEFLPNSFSQDTEREKKFKNLKNNLNEYIALTETFLSKLDSTGKESRDKLESLRGYYLMELEASREELDSRIKSLQYSFSSILEGENPQVENYNEQILRKLNEIDNDPSQEMNKNGNAFKSGKEPEPASSVNDEKPVYRSAVSEIGKYRESADGKFKRFIAGLIFFGILAACLLVFIFYSKDYSGQKLVEDSYRERAEPKSTEKISSDGIMDNDKSVMKNSVAKDIEKPVVKKTELNNKFEKTDNLKVENKTADSAKSTGKTFTIKGVGANIRKGPGINYPVAATARSGDPLKGLDEKNGHWIKVRMSDGTEGWVSGKLLNESISTPVSENRGPDFFTLRGTAANVRTGPGTAYEVLTVVKKGEKFEAIEGQSRHWRKIKLNDGREGWISGKLIIKIPD